MLTVAELRKHVETPLEDDALRRLLDAAEEDVAHFSAAVEYITPAGTLLPLTFPASAITTVIENDVTLNVLDYELSSSGMLLRRLDTGPNPYRTWHRSQAKVTYVRRTNEATKEIVQVDLVRLDLREPGIRQQQIGSWSESYGNALGTEGYRAQRAQILSRLNGPASLIWPV